MYVYVFTLKAINESDVLLYLQSDTKKISVNKQQNNGNQCLLKNLLQAVQLFQQKKHSSGTQIEQSYSNNNH